MVTTSYISPEMEACQGDDIEIIPMLWSSNGPVSYLWTDPIGSTSNEEILSIIDIRQNQSGTYTLRVSDTLDCYSEASVNLIVHPAPLPAFVGQDTIITEKPLELDAGDQSKYIRWVCCLGR